MVTTTKQLRYLNSVFVLILITLITFEQMQYWEYKCKKNTKHLRWYIWLLYVFNTLGCTMKNKAIKNNICWKNQIAEMKSMLTAIITKKNTATWDGLYHHYHQAAYFLCCLVLLESKGCIAPLGAMVP